MQAIESVALSKESNDITLVYTSRIENAISQLLPLTEKIETDSRTKRFICLKLLQGDSDTVYSLCKNTVQTKIISKRLYPPQTD